MSIKLYLISFAVFFIIDMVWLGLVAKNFYQTQIGHLMKTDINWAAALIFYLVFLAGIVFFVISPNLANGNWISVLLAGMFFGFVTYATYDLTNLATLKDWPIIVTVVDLVWGSVLSGSVSVITFLIAKKIGL